jgi:hypothetical protein
MRMQLINLSHMQTNPNCTFEDIKSTLKSIKCLEIFPADIFPQTAI